MGLVVPDLLYVIIGCWVRVKAVGSGCKEADWVMSYWAGFCGGCLAVSEMGRDCSVLAVEWGVCGFWVIVTGVVVWG